MTSIAINCDVAESFGVWTFGDDPAILQHITAANVACGFHAGDPSIIRGVCGEAVARGISIGAQVSYRDLAGFGRRFIDVPQAELVNDLLYQIGALRLLAEVEGGRVSYVKAHGALYNVSAKKVEHAEAIIEAVALAGDRLPVLCQPGKEVWRAAEAAGVEPVAEVFADRAYTTEWLLVPRSQPGAVITDPQQAAEQSLQLVRSRSVTAITGETVQLEITPRTVCLHSDTPGAADIARQVAKALHGEGITLTGLGR
jgi:UPF0271 protein